MNKHPYVYLSLTFMSQLNKYFLFRYIISTILIVQCESRDFVLISRPKKKKVNLRQYNKRN